VEEMSRTVIFWAAILAGAACLVMTLLYWTGSAGLGLHVKHGILFLGLAMVAFLFGVVNRPGVRSAP
jgi:hypothetical protein